MTDARSPETDVVHARRVPDSHICENVLAVLVTRRSTWKAVLEAILSGTKVPGRIVVASPEPLSAAAGDDTEINTDEKIVRVEEGAAKESVNFTADSTKKTDVTFRVIPGARTLGQTLNAVVEELKNPEGEEEEEEKARASEEAAAHAPLEWLWVLHDDSTPENETLELLLYQAERSQKLGALGPKQISPEGHLLEVGIRATRQARRVPEMETGEMDQGQYDNRSDVLAVGSAGMLVRFQAGESVGWFNPVLGPYGDGLEFSRKLWNAGWRVAVVPEARIVHRQNSLEDSDFGRRRAAQMYNALVAAPAWNFPFLFLAFLMGGPLRAVCRLVISKETLVALQELKAVGLLLGMAGSVFKARSLNRKIRDVPPSVLRALEESPRDVRKARRNARKTRKEAVSLETRPDPITLAERKAWKRSTRRAAFFTLFVAIAVSLASFMGNFSSRLSGGALLPDSWGATDIAQAWLQTWLPSADGYAAPVDALWILLTPFVAIFGSLGALTSFLVIAAVPLSAAAAFYATGSFTHSPHVRAMAGLGWAFAPPLLAAVAQGHMAGIMWHILAPLAARTLIGAWRGKGSALGCTAILGAYMAAATPATLLILLVAACAGLALRRGQRKRWLWLPVPGFVALAPTIYAAMQVEEPWRLLASTPGENLLNAPSGLGFLTFNPLASITGISQVRAEFLTVAFSAFLLGIALVALLLRRRNHPTIAWGWVLIGGGLTWAVAASATTTGVTPVGAALQSVSGWAGMGLSASCLGLMLALVGAGDGLRSDLAQRSFGLSHVFSFLSVALCFLLPLLMGVSSVINARSSASTWLVKENTADHIPAVARASSQGTERGRTLVLSPVEGGIQAQLLRGNGYELHETSTVKNLAESRVSTRNSKEEVRYDAANSELASAVASLAGDSSTFSAQVSRHAVAIVLVTGEDSLARRTLISQLKATSGLTYVSASQVGEFWRVNDFAGRVSIHDDDKSTALPSMLVRVEAEVAPSQTSRTLVLAERNAPGWRAMLNGEELKKTGSSWYQEWVLPQEGGTLTIDYDRTTGVALCAVQLLVAFAAIVVALPSPRRKRGIRGK